MITTLTDMDACELLDADHLAVKHLFVEYARLAFAAPDAGIGPRTDLAQSICDALTEHARLEEEIFYPALREAAPEAAPLLDHAEAEHGEAKALVETIRSLGRAGPEMDDAVAKLAWSVELHVKEERDLLFPIARTCGLDLDALAQELRNSMNEQ